jgi:hypothetical protein
MNVSDAEIKLDAYVNNRHDDAAQVDHAPDEIGCTRDPGHGVMAAQLQHLEKVASLTNINVFLNAIPVRF